MEPSRGRPPGEGPHPATELVASSAEEVPGKPEARRDVHASMRHLVRAPVEYRIDQGVVWSMPPDIQDVGANAHRNGDALACPPFVSHVGGILRAAHRNACATEVTP